MKETTNNFVFLADDDSDDRELFETACSEVDSGILYRTFGDGKSLLDFLKQSDNELPDILFLDINMPKKNGFQCLKEVRNTDRLYDLCVIMYSTSNNSRDICKSYELGANGFVQKPNSFSDLKEILAKIFDTNWRDPCSKLDDLNFVLKATPDISIKTRT